MRQKTEFYCENCEHTSYIRRIVTTEGFEVECPECDCIWWFSAEKYSPGDSDLKLVAPNELPDEMRMRLHKLVLDKEVKR